MAYNYFGTGSQVIGDLIAVVDPQLNTKIDFEDDTINLVTSGSTVLSVTKGGVSVTGSFVVTGAAAVSPYLQLLPVTTVAIPTNQTASYIYTSGSTNDMYFTQYQPGSNFNNTTRLRWLEGMLTTGLLHGGVLSTVTGSTTFSITSGSGLILSYNTSTSSDPYPTINFISWPAYVSQSLTYITSSLITYIGINPTGGIIQQTSPFTLTTDSDYITIGRVLHQSGSVTNGVSTQPLVSYGNNHWQDDFMRAFGPLKVSGHILAASGSTLGITKTAGDSYVIGRNYTTDPNNPNNISSTTDTAVTVSKIYRAYVSGSTLRLDTGVNNAGYTTINPAQYNNNGTLASVGASDASIQRVYWYPNSNSRAFTVYYGSAVYADPPGGTNALDVAQQNIASENFVEGENTAGAAILVGYILVLGNATNLSNTAQARFIQAGVSRGAGAGGGGGVAVGATTAAGLDTYVQFNDGGSTFGGDAGLVYNKTTDTLSGVVAQFTTITGSTVIGSAYSGGSFVGSTVSGTTSQFTTISGSTVTGSTALFTTISGSTITGSNITLAGDIAVNGGDITTTSTTFNLVTGSATTVNFAQSATTLNIGKTGGSSTISGILSASDGIVVLGASTGDINTTKTTATLFNTIATTINIGGAATNINIGSSTATGSTTLNTDIYLRTGNLIGAPGAGANVLSLISSGNIVAKLDVDNNATGHKFIVQDNLSIERFSAGEDGNIFINPSSSGTGQAIWVSGSNTVGGSTYIDFIKATNNSIGATTPSKTFRLTNSGTFEIVNSAYSSTIYTLDDAGNVVIGGSLSVSTSTVLGKTSERITMSSAGTGSVTFDTTNNSIFYNNGPIANITANFTNVSTTNDRATSVTVILSQSATPRTISAVQINSTSSTINWANKTTPTPNANQHDIFGFSLIRSGSTWITLGQMSTYG